MLVGKWFLGNCLYFALFLLAPRLCCAGTITHSSPPLTVLMDFEGPHSEASLKSFKQSLNLILNPGGIQVDVALKKDLPPNAQFGQLVIFKMKGSCSMNPVHHDLKVSDTGPLALAYTSDGQVLHFGEVECDHLRHTLERILGMSGSLRNQQAYGTALAVVVAHEVYHMLGNAINHTRRGLTKAALSASELTDAKLSLSANAMTAIKKSVHGDAGSESTQ